MLYFDGIIYRIWAECGIMFLLGVTCILIEKPWRKTFRIRNCTIGIVLLVLSLLSCIFYASRIAYPHVKYYEGAFVQENRNSRVAPPLPLTNEYKFLYGKEKKQVFYLDVISRKKIIPSSFILNQTYRIYYDELTRIIVAVEECR